MLSNANQEIESRGPTVDAAVATGLQRMGLERDDVTIIIIDEGSRGLLGIGSREAIVRLIARPSVEEPAPVVRPSIPAAPKPATPARQVSEASETPARPVKKRETADEDDAADEEQTADALDAERETAVEIISTLLEKMRVPAGVSGYLTEPDDLTGRQVNIIDISGDDLGMLIGPRGETLDSLQFLSRLMVAHKLHRRANFVVDVEGFRQRREQALTRLAERMAEKARQRGEAVTLEPMSAYERRIIHMTLREAAGVYTESTGEGKQRRVRIIPQD
ncbi:MAG TPA: RNA-binding cell elongation regulator Jag/EloR [Promineifilum sp.]|nr:RNA-binding cell elongation regulator Jag/EloR [Promineifilum sp.]